MVFSSLIFLFRFLPLVLICYYVLPQKFKNPVLLVFSLFFYAWGEPIYILLMVASIAMNFSFGIIIDKCHNDNNIRGKKIFLIVAVTLNLLLLGAFKYTDFAIGTFNTLFGLDNKMLGIALPIGISFYTFQAMSYVIDVYRRDARINKNIISFGTYISMFPQLIAGPIVRYQTVDNEIRGRKESVDDFADGIFRFVCGLGKKVLLANNIGLIWDRISSSEVNELSTLTAWLGVAAYTLQIYFDFSGYSDMAIGLGKMFGFHFLENFEHPYESKSITEFWRRWHISLGTWFREYVYYPLGGNKKGLIRQLINIVIVWFLTGLWHGASWNFVLWGIYYAVILLIEKLFMLKILKKMPGIISGMYTLFLVIVGWGIFAFNDIKIGLSYFKAMFFDARLGLVSRQSAYLILSYGILIVIGIIGCTTIPQKVAVKIFGKHKSAVQIAKIVFILGVFLLSLSYLVADTYNPFLYFRF